MTVNRGRAARTPEAEAGFSLVEMVVSLTVLALVVGALSTLMIHATLSQLSTTNRFESLQTARAAVDFIGRDLRSAGYGVDAGNPAGPQPAIAYVDSMQILMCENQSPYPDTSDVDAPEAYNPAGTPNPRPLVASPWTPPCKYTTGAEIIRYTLDLDDDGQVNANDIASPMGADARRTRQPGDYTLVREVYGDGSGGVTGNNGGSAERIALVMKPGNGIAPLFDVYLSNGATPWDWSNGPVPADKLPSITSIAVHVTASSPRPDSRGNYTLTDLKTLVPLERNAPSFDASTYTVDGYVYEDQNLDGSRQSGEPGLAGAVVRLGTGRVAYTAPSGYFSFRVPVGTYTLRHTAPMGYGSFAKPDSFVVNVAGPQSFTFADTACQGAWVNAKVWEDVNQNGVMDAGESVLPGVLVGMVPGGNSASTNASGVASLFVPAGAWAVAATPPANYSLATINPVTGTAAGGAAIPIAFGMFKSTSGTLSGTVYLDKNSNATFDGTDTGISGVTVTVTDASGSASFASGTTDGSGNFSLTVPQNGSAATGYTITCAQPAGMFPTTALTIANVKVGAGATVSGENFGFGQWSLVKITTGAVTAMAASDLWENDGATVSTTRGDVDLTVAYTDALGPKLAYWYNNYPTSTFSSSPSATYTPSRPVTTIAADSTWNAANSTGPPDVLVGFASGTGDWGVWGRKNAKSAPPGAQTKTYTTTSSGAVQDILLYQCSGSAYPDAIVGIQSTTPGSGSFEIWTGSTSSSGSYKSNEVYPPAGGVASMGEVNALALLDVDNSGTRDLAVATKLGPTSGAVLVFQFVSTTKGNRFVYKYTIALPSDVPVQLGVADVDGDGRADLVVGTQTGSTTGRVLVYRNNYAASPWTFTLLQAFSAPGAVTALATGDLGGSPALDLAVGYCTSTLNDGGGVRVYYNAGGLLSTTGVDPTNGALAYTPTALAIADFNYGTYPSKPAGPSLPDLAVGWRQTSTSGGITVLLR